MTDYDIRARKRLGAAVRHARSRHGFRDTNEWSDHVGRSGRQLLGLERGEKVGDETLELVAEALGWPPEVVPAILEGKAPAWWPRSFEEWLSVCTVTVDYERMRENQRPRDPDAPLFKNSNVPDLDEASDEEIVEELLRRLRLRREAAEAVVPEEYDYDQLAARRTGQVPDGERIEHIDPVQEDGPAGED